MSEALVSIITPVYNGAAYVEQAWQSVQSQTHSHWEWLVVDNNSSDHGIERLRTLTSGDGRVKFLEEHVQGTGAARNRALREMQGEFVVFLDIDDALPSKSLSARVDHMKAHPEQDVVDGRVEVRNADFSEVIRQWSPAFEGVVFPELLKLSEACFFGPSWMVRRKACAGVWCANDISHCEDLLFYLSLGQVRYGWVDETVLQYRSGNASLMQDLGGLERGYLHVVHWVENHPDVAPETAAAFRRRVRSVLVRSYAKRGRFGAAMRAAWRFQ